MLDDKNFTGSESENQTDFREVVSEENNIENEVVEVEENTTEKTEEDDNDEYEDTCYICRRPESVTGKMIRIYGGLTVCNDCMQRTLDAMNNSNFGMNPNMNL